MPQRHALAKTHNQAANIDVVIARQVSVEFQ
jgi:hypothetical protein